MVKYRGIILMDNDQIEYNNCVSKNNTNSLLTLINSKKYLVTVVIFTLAIILGFISDLIINVEENDFVSLLKSSNYAKAVNGVIIGGIILSLIVNILIAAGMWLFWLENKNLNKEYVENKGLSFIKVGIILSIFFMCVITITMTVGTIIVGNMQTDSYYKNDIILIGILTLWIGFVLQIIYDVLLLKTITVVKSIRLTGKSKNGISMLLIIINIIIAVCILISVINQGSLMIISSCISALFYILFTVFLLSVKKLTY